MKPSSRSQFFRQLVKLRITTSLCFTSIYCYVLAMLCKQTCVPDLIIYHSNGIKYCVTRDTPTRPCVIPLRVTIN